jgi:hypothetical protein
MTPTHFFERPLKLAQQLYKVCAQQYFSDIIYKDRSAKQASQDGLTGWLPANLLLLLAMAALPTA